MAPGSAARAPPRHSCRTARSPCGAAAAAPMKWTTIVLVLLGWLGACAAAGWLLMACSSLLAR